MHLRQPRTSALGFLTAALGLLFLGFACQPVQQIFPAYNANNATALSSWFVQEPTLTFQSQPDNSGTATVTVMTKPGTTVTVTLDDDTGSVTSAHVQTSQPDANGVARFYWSYSRGGTFTYQVLIGSNDINVATYDGTGYVK